VFSNSILVSSRFIFNNIGISMAMRTGGEVKDVLDEGELKHLADGFSAHMTGSLGEEAEMALLTEIGPDLNEEMVKRVNEKAEANKQIGEMFIQSYMLSNPKAKQAASGLVVNEIIIGGGKQAFPGATVTCHYTGSLPDGTVFDSSKPRGEPLEINLGQVIKGWQEGIPFMVEGGIAELICPPDIAYGDRGSPPVIPPHATLKFEIELIKVH
jgi:FKBP-type peptidyl-prolyl cis-trans isomerase